MHLTTHTPHDLRKIACIGVEPQCYHDAYQRMLLEFPNLKKYLALVARASSNAVAKSVGLRVLLEIRDDRRERSTRTADALSFLTDPEDRYSDMECPPGRNPVEHYLAELQALIRDR